MPNLRSLIARVERLSSEIVEVPLDDSGDNWRKGFPAE
jgi:uncharacterized protein (UPF0335 family)